MTTNTKYINSIRELLTQRKYRPRTVSSYMYALKSLFDFYTDISPDKITFAQISDFISYLLNRKKAAPATVKIYLSAFELFFNTLLSNRYNIQSLRLPSVPRKIPEILSPDEVICLLNSVILNTRHHLILSLIYSAGLEISQALRLMVDDIDFKNKQIKVRNSNGEIIRVPILANKLILKLQSYLSSYRPKKWFFEGRNKGIPFSSSAVQKAFKKGLLIANIDKKVSVRSLKYSYVKHVELYGIPLPQILKEMGIFSPNSLSFYSQMGVLNTSLSFSPLDRILHESSNMRVDTTSLEKSFARIQNKDEKSYLLEAIKCLTARAPRAAVVFAWNAAIRNIQYRCLLCDLKLLNNAIKKHYQKASWVESVDDFENIRERIVLETSHTLGIVNKREKNVLISCLDLRNQCGHPGTYMPDELRVAAFLEDLYNVVFTKSSPDSSKAITYYEEDYEDKYGFPF